MDMDLEPLVGGSGTGREADHFIDMEMGQTGPAGRGDSDPLTGNQKAVHINFQLGILKWKLNLKLKLKFKLCS
jgi:hypothetical protein